MKKPGYYLVPLGALIGGLCFLIAVQHLLFPFIISAGIAYLLNPAVVYFEIRGFRRSVAVWGIYVSALFLLAGTLFAGVMAIRQQALRSAHDFPAHFQKLTEAFHNGINALTQVPLLRNSGAGEWIQNFLYRYANDWVVAGFHPNAGIAQRLLPLLEYAFLIPFLTLFFMRDGKAFLNALVQAVPARYVERVINILVEIDTSLGNYVRGICFQALCMGFLAGIGFWLIGLNYSLQIAIGVALTSAIPLIGSLSAAAAGGTLALLQWGTPVGLFRVLGVCAGLRLVDEWILHPIILRRAVRVHPILMAFVLLAGGHFYGFWGMVFAVPAACIVKVFAEVLWQWYSEEYNAPPACVRPSDPSPSSWI